MEKESVSESRMRELFFKGFFLYSRVFYRLEVVGAENIPRQGACLCVLNHHGIIGDGLAHYVIRLRRKPNSLVSFAGQGLNGGLLDRFRPRRSVGRTDGDAGTKGPAILGAYKARGLSAPELLRALDYLRQGKAVVLAPEGEGSWDGRLKPLKPGAGWMALRSHVPIVPIVSTGGYDVLPRWTMWPRFTGRITVRVGEPFYLSDGSSGRIDDELLRGASRRIWEAMAALLHG